MNRKNSFVLYNSFYEPIKGLTSEEKGKLLDAFFQYQINDKIPELSPAVKMAFGFIKPHFDRDLEKWENIKKKRSEAGKRGAKATNDLKSQQTPANADTCQQTSTNPAKPANADTCQQTPTNPAKPANADTCQQSSTKPAVNVNVNVIKKKNIKKKKNIEEIFFKPTIPEIEKYCKERKNNIDPHCFYDHYESNGWKINKNSMKDWKATVRNWERRNKVQTNKPEEMEEFGGVNAN